MQDRRNQLEAVDGIEAGKGVAGGRREQSTIELQRLSEALEEADALKVSLRSRDAAIQAQVRCPCLAVVIQGIRQSSTCLALLFVLPVTTGASDTNTFDEQWLPKCDHRLKRLIHQINQISISQHYDFARLFFPYTVTLQASVECLHPSLINRYRVKNNVSSFRRWVVDGVGATHIETKSHPLNQSGEYPVHFVLTVFGPVLATQNLQHVYYCEDSNNALFVTADTRRYSMWIVHQ